MSQAQPRSPSPRTEPPNPPWFTTRVISLLLAWCWGIIGSSAGINALVKSNNQKAAVNKAVPRPTVVNINIQDVYVLGVLASTACLLIIVFTTTFLCMTLCRPQSFRRTIFFQAILLMSSGAWLFSALVPLTVFHARRSARVTAYLDGIQLPNYIVQTVENALDITNVYARIHYLRIAVVLPWFTFFFTLFAAVILFITSSRLDHLEQAHEEANARAGIQTRRVSIVDRDTNKEKPGPRRSPRTISEKSTVDSPESYQES